VSAHALDYVKLGFKAGLEIHQQLDTPKLFCRCPSRLDEDERVDLRFVRTLKPTASELGEVDRAAVEEARKRLTFEYVGSRHTACLVEADEEPPHNMGPEALDAALATALLLDALPVDEVHVMRKIVVDGSNTSGFQRTSLIATQGKVDATEGPVRMATFCLEEDSARRLDRVGNLQRYRLDRLGIPLIEIATEPDLKSPCHAREVAEAIGMALRATGKVKRGIGTIRQDVNVSIREGARVEIKGVQELRLIETAVEWEARRQVHLLDVRKDLAGKGAKEADYLMRPVVDLTDLFAHSKAKMVQSALSSGAGVFGVALPHLAGMLGRKGNEEVPPPRVGRELADYAKTKAGVKGIFHSDELPAYGITAEECAEVTRRLTLAAGDAFALVVEKKAVAEVALHAVLGRAAQLLVGVPEETRDLNPDGTSRYLRPLPGGARMYPETDVPPILLDEPRLARVRATLPEPPHVQVKRLLADFPKMKPEHAGSIVREGRAQAFRGLVGAYPTLSLEEATQLVTGGKEETFTAWAQASGLPKETARLLLNVIPELDPALPRAHLDATALDALRTLAAGAFAKEALPAVLAHALKSGVPAAEAAKALGFGAMDKDALRAEVDALLAKEKDLVEKQGMRAQGALMGPLMAKLKGKVSGQEISAMLKERLEAKVAGK
jgi:glutamyl-tRNA(Gln) amidotransferase subunit E